MHTNVLEQRQRFVRDALSGHWAMSELCERYGVSRPTGYTWLARYREGGDGALLDRSRAPQRCPHHTAPVLEARVVAARRKYGWGARKLRRRLQDEAPQIAWPSRSTMQDILARHGLVRAYRPRRAWAHPGHAPVQTVRPNQVWPTDFKGQCQTGDGQPCYPLTVTDHFSRRLLACQGLPAITAAATRAVFVTLFRAVGLPDAIRTDNGMPFASPGIHGLSRLNVWWMQLGIVHQRIRPASPQENGTHERMHRELKRETMRPAAGSRSAQQRRFNAFQHRYNEERPHEGIGDRTPNTLWTPSPRPYPDVAGKPEYPAALDVRRVSRGGTISWQGVLVFLSEVLQGEEVALEEVEDGIWNIIYYTTLLGRWEARTGLLTGVARNKTSV